MHTIKDKTLPRFSLVAVSALLATGSVWAQSAASSEIDEEDVVVLSPFEVSAGDDTQGYAAATTLAGNRLNTELRDIGNAVTVITSQFLKDIAATDNETLLQYTTGTEVGNLQGNFAGLGDGTQLDESGNFRNPNGNTRVRGLAEADQTRDFFLTDIPWDGYMVDRVDLQRGPNSILFGQGSPAGIINAGTKQASFKNSSEVSFRVGSYGSARASVDFNRVLLEDQLAIRVAAVKDDTRFQQDPAFQDSERIFAAIRVEPEFLKRGSARTILKANFEDGNTASNRPRTLPPQDLFTPWFYTGTYQGTWDRDVNYTYEDGTTIVAAKGSPRTFPYLNKITANAFFFQDDNTGRPGHGLTRPSINGGRDAGQPNRWFTPSVGENEAYDGQAVMFFDGATGQILDAWSTTRNANSGEGGRNTTGGRDNAIGSGFHRPGGVSRYSYFAATSRLPYSQFGVYKDRSLTDPTAYDYYNNLLDGPNKSEWQDFQSYNVSLAQTFLNDKFGVEIVFNHEDYENGQTQLLTGSNQAIEIDMNSVRSDGTPAGVPGAAPDGYNEPYNDGTPNPNVGRPYVQTSNGGNNQYVSERDGTRATAFFTHDFARNASDSNAMMKLLGKHTLTGLWAQEEQNTWNRNWNRYTLGQEWGTFTNNQNSNNWTGRNPAPVVYLGPSLMSASTAAGANVPRVMGKVTLPPEYYVNTFNATWNPVPPVGYNDVWTTDGYSYPWQITTPRREADNPDNYIGWTTHPITVFDAEANGGAGRDQNTTSFARDRSEVDSQAFVWQAHMWNNAVVGTYGWRKDTARAFAKNWSTGSERLTGEQRLDLPSFVLDPTDYNEVTVESNSYSIVAHLDELPGISRMTENLPFLTTLFYNKSENFQPAAERVDVYGEPLAAPAGTTTDVGILLETKDGRFSLKVNKYETEVLNANSNALGGAAFIGQSQQWSGNWVNKYEFNLDANDGIEAAVIPNNVENSKYNYGGGQDGETMAEAAVREARHIALWREWQASVDPRFYEAWSLDLNRFREPGATGLSVSTPPGFTVTEDAISKGYEIEMSAMPTRNWRLTFNASKTTAERRNIGGENLTNFINDFETFLNADGGLGGGDLRIWWGNSGNARALFLWNTNVGSEWAARKLQEGTTVPELREWRFNAISNYDFSEGLLKGVSVGGAVRWQDDVVIGFPPIPNPTDPNRVNFDLNSPFRGPAETNIDLWVGYSRRLSDKIDWRVQLNVRNVGEGNDLIPITVQPDGTPATLRIAPHQSWSLTNTFRF